MIAVIEDGGYVRGMVDRLRELEARQDELNERLSAAPADLPDIHPNIADVYRRKVARLAEAMSRKRARKHEDLHPHAGDVGLGGCGGAASYWKRSISCRPRGHTSVRMD